MSLNGKALVAACAGLAVATAVADAAMRQVAADTASNYTNDWSGNGGAGLDTWVFRADNNPPAYHAGAYLADVFSKTNLNGIASQPGAKAWGTYANGGTASDFPRMAAFRGFGWNGSAWTNALGRSGDVFRVSFEHGALNLNASCGFVLRHGNGDATPDDYNNGARFEFGLFRGDGLTDPTYTIYDGSGKLDTGVARRDSGLDLELTLTGTNAYALRVYDATNRVVLTNIVSTLSGSGTLDSVALYNRRNGASDDVYFNKIEIRKFYPPTLFWVK